MDSSNVEEKRSHGMLYRDWNLRGGAALDEDAVQGIQEKLIADQNGCE
jgi:hypothetical protein